MKIGAYRLRACIPLGLLALAACNGRNVLHGTSPGRDDASVPPPAPSEARVDPASAPPAGAAGVVVPARISSLEGDVYVKGADDAEWTRADVNVPIAEGDMLWADDVGRAEVELPEGVVMRMSSGAQAGIGTIAPAVTIRAQAGALLVVVPAAARVPVSVQAPSCSITVAANSYLRVDISESGYTRYTLYAGSAEITEPAGSGTVGAVNRFYVEPGSLPSDPEPVDPAEYDDVDRWSQGRDGAHLAGASGSRRLGSIPGADDLDPYGTWVQFDGRDWYAPRVAPEWRPYSNGYFTYVARYGYTWVSHDPFGYVTHHYGAWSFRPGYGWLWWPGNVWSAHRASFATVGSTVMWAPLDPWGRPASLGQVDATLPGGATVDLRAWSTMPLSGFTSGQGVAGPASAPLLRGPRLSVPSAITYRSTMPGRTPFQFSSSGERVSAHMVTVEERIARIPEPGVAVDRGRVKVKTAPDKGKFAVKDTGWKFQAKGGKVDQAEPKNPKIGKGAGKETGQDRKDAKVAKGGKADKGGGGPKGGKADKGPKGGGKGPKGGGNGGGKGGKGKK